MVQEPPGVLAAGEGEEGLAWPSPGWRELPLRKIWGITMGAALPQGHLVDLDVRSPAFLADPYPFFRALRDAGPVHHHRSGIWFLVGFDEVEAGLGDRAFTRYQNDAPPASLQASNPFFLDGPGHVGPRRIVVPALSNRALGRLRALAQRLVDTAFDDHPVGAPFRLVDEIGFPLPYLLMSTLFGLPELDDPSQLRSWTWRSLRHIDAFLSPEERQDAMDASMALHAHITEVVEWKRSHLADDLMSSVINAAGDGRMSPEQLVPYLQTLYLAGMHTTVHQVALSVLALLNNRSQWELVAQHRSLLDNAVEELLRYEPTAQYMKRAPGGGVEVGGTAIPGDAEIVAWIGSANRDEAHWGPTAATLDVRRGDARSHIAFGKGPHSCVGSWLARLELQSLIGTLVSRFPRTELASNELVWESAVIRGPRELLLALRP